MYLLFVSHGTFSEHRHFSHCVLLQSFHRITLWTKQLSNEIEFWMFLDRHNYTYTKTNWFFMVYVNYSGIPSRWFPSTLNSGNFYNEKK